MNAALLLLFFPLTNQEGISGTPIYPYAYPFEVSPAVSFPWCSKSFNLAHRNASLFQLPDSDKKAMIKEVKARAKVGVGLDLLLKALSRDLRFVLPKATPNVVKEAHLVEGDGGLGTIYLVNFGHEMEPLTYQKEKVVELEASIHRISKEITEGAHHVMGFSYYCSSFQLIAIGEKETLVDVTIAYETQMNEVEETTMITMSKSSTLDFVKRVEFYLVNDAAAAAASVPS